MKKLTITLNRKSVTFRLFLWIFALWLLFSVAVFGSLRVISMKQLENTIRSQKENISYFSAIVNDDLDRVIRLLYTLCGDADVQKFVNQRDDTFDYQDYLAYYDAYSKLEDYRQTSMYIDDIFILLPATGELLTANYSVIPIDDTYKAMIDGYLESKKSFFNNKNEMFYLLQGGNGIMCGITVSVQHIRNTLRSYSDNGYDFYLVDSVSGEMLGESGASGTGIQIYRRMRGESELPEETRIGGQTYLLEKVHTPNNHFDIILYSEKDAVYRDVYYIRQVWAFLTVMAVMLPFAIAWLLRRMISRPMNRLVTAMRKVEQEIYDYRLPEDESEEFNYVFRQYNSMAAKVENLIQEVYEKQIQVEQAKLKQLQAQINPHFLFNSFYMGYRMAKSGDTEKVAQLCLYLGDYFRVLTYVSDDFISLQEEMKFTETYLLLYQMRYEGRLFYEIDQEKGLEQEMIPPLLLQPVIENSICHGVEKTGRACRIRITVKREDGQVAFRVEDDCRAITPEEVEKLKMTLDEPVCPGRSFGLWNIQQRLKALRPGSGGLSLRITEDGCFRVEFRI